jgi:RNA-binding protein
MTIKKENFFKFPLGNKKDIMEFVHHSTPVMILGKGGLTDNIIKDLKTHLKKKKLIKVKLLKSFVDGKNKKELFNEIAQKTDSELVHKIGFVIVLEKK